MIELNFTPFPELTSDRFVLRELLKNDAAEIFVMRSDKNVLRYLDIKPATKIDDALAFIEKIKSGVEKNEWIMWAVSYKEMNQIVGTICLWNISIENSSAEIGYTLLPEYQGKGIMQEIVPTIINFGFEKLKLKNIEGEVFSGNIKSVKLMERFGFKYNRQQEETLMYRLENTKF